MSNQSGKAVEKPSIFTRFLWACSGVNQSVLVSCPRQEWIKYAGVGATVLFTGLLATLSGGYAFFTIFQSLTLAVFFGLFWGAIIFNLDRYIVSTLKNDGDYTKMLLQAFPRIILSIVLGFVISKPLELKIFEREINQKITEKKGQLSIDCMNRARKQFSELDSIKSEIAGLKKEIEAKELTRSQIYKDFIAEAEGTAGTGKVGKGPVYKEKKMEYDKLDLELQEIKQRNETLIQDKLDRTKVLQLDFDKASSVCTSEVKNFDGLKARIEALGYSGSSIAVMLLLIMIELAPVLSKIFAPKGSYDDKIKEIEHRIEADILRQIHERNHELNQKFTLLTSLDQARIEQEVENNKDALKMISNAHLELVEEYVKDWLESEKEKLKKKNS